MSIKKMRAEQYSNYLEDVRLAKEALAELKLEVSMDSLVCDLYAVPSHNHQAYYAKVFVYKGRYHILYARSVIDVLTGGSIFMYPFRSVKKAGDPRGRIVCGLKVLDDTFAKRLWEGLQQLPNKHILDEDMVVICDGVFQVVRVFEGDRMVKEVVYQLAQCLAVEDEWKAFFEDLYLDIEKIINHEV